MIRFVRLACIALLLAACSSTPRPSSSVITITLDAALEGTLVIDEECSYLDDGLGDRHPVVWPAG